jgi:hypothetical protein
MTIARCQLHGEELEGEWEDNPPATRIVANFSRSLWLCEDCYKMICQHDLHLV